MSFRSIHHILGLLENRAEWQERQQFQQLSAAWVKVVGTTIAAQTRPLGIQRQILQVATSNSVWSQNLAFDRIRILDCLNAQLAIALVDIRFSPRQWQADRDPSIAATAKIFQAHPCRVEPSSPDAIDAAETAHTSATAFQHWALVMQQRSQHLPNCPVCQCPTPVGELQRWSMCAHCAVKQW